jgi:mono/diheme cytochrome c family protein
MGEGLYTLPVGPRLRNGLLAAAVLLVVAGLAWDAGLRPPPALVQTPEASARGREFVRSHCLHCHATIALAPRVRGWSPRRAYDVLGQLPAVSPAMPPFPGSESDRCDVASYLSSLGSGAARAP